MIKENKIKVNISSRNVTYYREKNYNCKIKDQILINPKDLPLGSHVKITAICEICEKEIKLPYHKYVDNMNRHNYYGCKKCSRVKYKLTNIELFGEDNFMKTDIGKKLVENTMLEKFGYKTNLLHPDYIDLNKKIMNEKYGVDYPMQSLKIRKKSKSTLKEKYNVEHFSKTEMFKNNLKYSWEKGIINKLKNYNIEDYFINDNINIFCENCNKYYEISSKNLYQRRIIQNSELCTICNPLQKSWSNKEKELLEFIKNNYNGKIIENSKNIINGELDIYLPELKVAFEFNGDYWHSIKFKDKYFHENKTHNCIEKNINLYHIFESDWDYRKKCIKILILEVLGKNPIIDITECEEIDISKDTKALKYKDKIICLIFINNSNNQFHYEMIENFKINGLIDKYLKNYDFILDKCYYLHNFKKEYNFKELGPSKKMLRKNLIWNSGKYVFKKRMN